MKAFKLILIFLSIFICINFACHSQNGKSVAQKTEKITATATPVSEDGNIDKSGGKKVEVSCNDKELSPIWKILIDDEDVKQMIIESNLGGDCSDYITIVKKIDLNKDGNKEIFVEGNGNWGAVSTTPIWLVGKIKDKPKILLREQGENYEIKKTRVNGYNDLFFPSRRNVYSLILSFYKFDGEKYQVSSCQVAFYEQSNNPVKTFDCDDKENIDKFESEMFRAN